MRKFDNGFNNPFDPKNFLTAHINFLKKSPLASRAQTIKDLNEDNVLYIHSDAKAIKQKLIGQIASEFGEDSTQYSYRLNQFEKKLFDKIFCLPKPYKFEIDLTELVIKFTPDICDEDGLKECYYAKYDSAKEDFYKSFLDNELEFNIDLCKVDELDEYKEEATLDDWQIKNSFFVILKFNHKNNSFSSLLLKTEDLENIKNYSERLVCFVDYDSSIKNLIQSKSSNLQLFKFSNGDNFLHKVIKSKKHFHHIKTFLELTLDRAKDWDLATKDGEGNNILHLLVQNCFQYSALITKIIEQRPELVNSQNNLNKTPLHIVIASSKWSELVIDLLIKNNADIFLQDDQEKTAIDYALENEEFKQYSIAKIIDLFVEKQRKQSSAQLKIKFDKRDSNDRTLLHLAVLKNFYGLCEKILSIDNSIVNCQDCDGNTALHLVILGAKHQEKSNISEGSHIYYVDSILISCILEHHDLIDINIVNNNNNTVLHEAVLAENYYAFCEIVNKFRDRINWGLINNNNEPLDKLILAKGKKYADIAGIGIGNNVELIEDKENLPSIPAFAIEISTQIASAFAIENYAYDVASRPLIFSIPRVIDMQSCTNDTALKLATLPAKHSKKPEFITANDRVGNALSSIAGVYYYPITQAKIQSSLIINFDSKEENLQLQNTELSLYDPEVKEGASKSLPNPAIQSSDSSQNLPPQTTKTTCFNKMLKFFKPKCFANIHQ